MDAGGREFRFRGDLYSQESTFPLVILVIILVVVVVVTCSDLLGSTSSGIEVSYNACGIFAHIMSDGPGAWTVTAPSRQVVLRDMATSVSQWKLDSKRNINYR